MKRKTTSVLVLLLISLSLGSCAMRVAYNLLDVALLWSLDDYIDFDKEQRANAKVAIDDFHQWHRIEQLPAYARLLDELANDIQRPVTEKQLASHYKAVLNAWQVLLRELGRSSAPILADLNDEQVQALIKRMAQEEADDTRKYQRETPMEVRDERYEMMEKSVKKLTGKVTHEQKVMILRWASALHDMGQMSLDHRRQWRKQFVTLLSERSVATDLTEDLGRLFSEPYLFWSDGYQDSMDYNQARTLKLMTDIANSMTNRQRKKAVKRLHNLADDCRALHESNR